MTGSTKSKAALTPPGNPGLRSAPSGLRQRAMTLRMVACESFFAQSHRDTPSLGSVGCDLPSKINTESQSLFHALLFCYIRRILLT
jgi:hypothetical protein